METESKADKLSRATELALDVVLKILSLEIDAGDLRLLAQVKETALAVIGQQIRVDEARLRRAEGEQLVEYTAAVERQEKLLEPEKKQARPAVKAPADAG